ncbi:V-type ATP synthase subunit A [Lachnoclostridium phytofermentans]|uniref:V-type ATP synthase alpha chain n=1 Tax=Lachnoclostridium phytofermentans (strain ATCC 700394 / DSM 18823 / ISDg) TaxID=357809 RepID=A9KHU8_LACP7|nr:V-type ATP synthase subunit A [Lachnoclostridium phytofermentans]ABX43795.1 H+transporting two-sector ATPase alpha/beta subunit central region [Lachnoclostridium phytofermentans ISDg]
MSETAKITGINGPVVYVKGKQQFRVAEMVLVGKQNLVGEVISLQKGMTTIQVFEETTGLRPGDEVTSTGSAISVTLAPGIISNIFDGIQRPLSEVAKQSGAFISRGVNIPSLDEKRLFQTHITVAPGELVYGGKVIAEVPETPAITHKVMVPPHVEGKVISVVSDGEYTIKDTIVVIKDRDGKEINLTMTQEWPIRISRPIGKRFPASMPLVTGQRILDSLFPLAKGGTAAIPGGFGTGKTMTQHQLAKWSDADIIVYIGCGERGNEMTEVLEDFSKLVDPKSGNLLLDRTVLIANTSNMPVAAREASIYTGITLAEYYRDMGYHVAIMADSTSRWAEALRELSGRLEEMPAEEGFPAYLASRLSSFYERAGYVQNLNGSEGSVSIIGAVSPQGGDFSEPVTQNTKRFVRCFFALDKSLAYARHFPAIQWLTSYSEYLNDLAPWYAKNVGNNFMDYRNEILRILTEESKLNEIVKLIGSDVLPDDQKLTLEIARVIRLGFIQQNAYHASDTYVPLPKQMKMMEVILYLYEKAKSLVEMNMPMSLLRENPIFDHVISMKYDVGNEELAKFDTYKTEIDKFYQHFIETNA